MEITIKITISLLA